VSILVQAAGASRSCLVRGGNVKKSAGPEGLPPAERLVNLSRRPSWTSAHTPTMTWRRSGRISCATPARRCGCYADPDDLSVLDVTASPQVVAFAPRLAKEAFR